MKTIIIEDEPAAANRLKRIIGEVAPELEVVKVLDSVEGSVKYLKKNAVPELIITDVQLSDGPCFDIFKEVDVNCPVIFATAYDQYAVKAFKLNSLDYLLKPINKDEFGRSIEKLKKLHIVDDDRQLKLQRLAELISSGETAYQKRLVVKVGQKIKAIDMDEVAYFYTEAKINFMVTKDANRYTIDYNLEALENMLNPSIFFRINRQFIVNFDAIENMIAYSKSRVKLILNPPSEHETITSTERSPVFKKWLTGDKA